MSHHEAVRRFGIDCRTVKKMLTYAGPQGYRRTKPVRQPKLDGFTVIIDATLLVWRALSPLRWFGLVECRQDPTSKYGAFWRKRALFDRFLGFDARVVRTEGSLH